MKLPRDLSGHDLARLLEPLGYRITRERGSHLRLTTQQGGEHHITIPDHDALRVGTPPRRIEANFLGLPSGCERGIHFVLSLRQ